MVIISQLFSQSVIKRRNIGLPWFNFLYSEMRLLPNPRYRTRRRYSTIVNKF